MLDSATRAWLERVIEGTWPIITLSRGDVRDLLAAHDALLAERDAIQAHYSSLRRKYDALEARQFAAEAELQALAVWRTARDV